MILPISKLPSKILRLPTREVVTPASRETLRLVKNMIDTCRSADGVGLAAPQIAQDLKLAVIFLEEMGLAAFPIINPRIISVSKETDSMEEGCLSMPGVYGMVTRPKKITIEAVDLDGEGFRITDDTFLARVLQHEIDHLNQTLIIDKFDKVTQGQDLIPKFDDHFHH